MSDTKTKINVVEQVCGDGISITQVYAPGNAGIEPERFVRKGNARPFSLDWLMFVEEAVPFFGRTGELGTIKAFLEDSAPFSWWCVVGPGGAGKSRLALQAVRQLPEGWAGGFLPKDSISMHRAAAWRPTVNTLWVIDYAADHVSRLRPFLALCSRLLVNSPYRLRILLLERGFSDETGWWDELNHALVRERGAIETTLFGAPLVLAPMGNLAPEFLRHVAEILPEPDRNDLSKALAHETFAASTLAGLSEQGNPLLLLLLAAEAVRCHGQLPKHFRLSSPDIVGRYLDRELDMLRDRVHRHRLRFTQAADILFLTTSVHPLDYIRGVDKLIIADPGENGVNLEEFRSGQRVAPSLSELGEVGRGIADKHNRTVLENLGRIVDVDDAEPYLVALEDAGLSGARRWSLQPDLLGEAFIRLMVNSPVLRAAHKQKRPEYRRTRIAGVIEGAVGLSLEKAARNWARLDTPTLMALIGHLRDQGQSVRLMLVAFRRLNALRNEKLPFDANEAFSMNNPRSRSAALGHYYKAVWARLDDDDVDDKPNEGLAESEHAWLLPYFEFLHVLSPRQKYNLARLICRVHAAKTLSRLTNLANFVYVLGGYATQIASIEDPAGWRGMGLDLGEAIDRIMTYMTDIAMPVLVAAGEKDFKEPFEQVARGLLSSSYAILNQLLDRRERAADYDRALHALDVARTALEIAPDTETLAYVDRNAAAITMRLKAGSPEAIRFNIDILTRLGTFAGSIHYSYAVVEFLHYASQIASSQAIIEGFEHLLQAAPKGLAVLRILVPAIPAIVSELIKPEVDQGDATAILLSVSTYLRSLLRNADDPDAFGAFGDMLEIAVPFCMERSPIAVRQFFEHSRTILDKEQYSPDFRDTILQAMTLAAFWLREAGITSAPLPFDVAFEQQTVEEQARRWETVPAEVAGIVKVTAIYQAPGGGSAASTRYVAQTTYGVIGTIRSSQDLLVLAGIQR